MQKSDDIFSFNDPIDFLNYQLKLKKNKNPRFSLRSWSSQLDYKNPSLLSQVLSRKRTINSLLLKKIISNLKLSGAQKKYFEVLILYKKSKTLDEQKLYLDIIDELRPKSSKFVRSIDIELFKVISDWHHTAILELLNLKDFQSNPVWIRKALNYEVSTSEIDDAIKRLISLKLIEKSKTGKLVRRQNESLLLENNISSSAIQSFHKKMLDKASSAIESQCIEDRDLRGSTLAIKSSDYKKILEIIKYAHSEIIKYASSGDGDEVCHFNTQFFHLTKKERSL